ncbi:hypothetical protein HMPREF3203_02314 [Proteus mirabilis]|nr:hypothetical protein HMPREF3203_02314 [Proteus mirabilis]
MSGIILAFDYFLVILLNGVNNDLKHQLLYFNCAFCLPFLFLFCKPPIINSFLSLNS